MSAIENLSDEECALLAILTDKSGIDLACLAWHEPDKPDGTFRPWPFQYFWWNSTEPQQIDCCARSVGKSLSIQLRGFAFPFLHPGEEMVVTAPELVHLEPIVSLIENRFYNTRLGREMMVKGRSGVTHRPFHMQFQNSARILGRIPQRDGKGMKGIHPIWLEMDEASDYPRAGWVELSETLKRGFDGAVWRAHGVTRGIRDKFYEYTQPGSGWKVHNYPAMARPNFTDEEREAAIRRYGSREDPDYRRNMLGKHGNVQNRLFILSRLMRCVDSDESSTYNTDDYFHLDIKDTELEQNGTSIEDLLDFPNRHKKYTTTWIGMDVGFLADPSEILVFAEYHPDPAEIKADKAAERAVPEDGKSRVKCIARITLRRIGSPDQAAAILRTIDFYNPRGFAMDKGGNGLPLFQDVQSAIKERGESEGLDPAEIRESLGRIKGYNFGEKVLVEFDESIEVMDDDDPEKKAAEAGMRQYVLEFSTDVLRTWVDTGRLMLPMADKELIAEFSGQTFSFGKDSMDGYGRRRRLFSEGTFHALYAARLAAMAIAQAPIETFMAQPKPAQQPVYDSFLVM